MNEQRSPWAQPGVIAMLGVIVGINVVIDWFVFRLKNWPFFIVAEIVVMGGIVALVRCWRSRP